MQLQDCIIFAGEPDHVNLFPIIMSVMDHLIVMTGRLFIYNYLHKTVYIFKMTYEGYILALINSCSYTILCRTRLNMINISCYYNMHKLVVFQGLNSVGPIRGSVILH